ncbi:shikimate dehydrogenase [Vibrio sp.]|nr:shikimate dehydrogenase [Vibrio sp.]
MSQKHLARYAVFGNPISHSKSPAIHTRFAKQAQQPLIYTAEFSEVDAFPQTLKAFFQNEGRGCNVTAPFKEEAYQLVNQLTERAKLAGAINTLKVLEDGSLLGDNTDGAGLVIDLLNKGATIKNARILLIGAGGAARGVIKPILDQNPAQLIITNRTYSKAETLVSLFESYGSVVSREMENIEDSFDIIINSTSASLAGDLPHISSSIFSEANFVYDMMYAAEETTFNQWARESGCANCIDGLGMLVGQAAESFSLWRGVMPETFSVEKALRQELVEK